MSVSSASCSSSASRATGHDSAATSAIAAGSSAPTPPASGPSVRRICTARARRSSSGASSRYAYGFAFRISCENGDGSGVSIATVFSSPVPMSLDQLLQAVEIHRLVQAVLDRLVDQRMIGNADVADDVFLTGGLIRKHRGQQIVGAHALDLRRHLASAREPQHGQRARRVPSPAHFEHRRRQHRLRQHFFDGFLAQELEDQLERKAVLLARAR